MVNELYNYIQTTNISNEDMVIFTNQIKIYNSYKIEQKKEKNRSNFRRYYKTVLMPRLLEIDNNNGF